MSWRFANESIRYRIRQNMPPAPYSNYLPFGLCKKTDIHLKEFTNFDGFWNEHLIACFKRSHSFFNSDITRHGVGRHIPAFFGWLPSSSAYHLIPILSRHSTIAYYDLTS